MSMGMRTWADSGPNFYKSSWARDVQSIHDRDRIVPVSTAVPSGSWVWCTISDTKALQITLANNNVVEDLRESKRAGCQWLIDTM